MGAHTSEQEEQESGEMESALAAKSKSTGWDLGKIKKTLELVGSLSNNSLLASQFASLNFFLSFFLPLSVFLSIY